VPGGAGTLAPKKDPAAVTKRAWSVRPRAGMRKDGLTEASSSRV
jgi:hypothetical protein